MDRSSILRASTKCHKAGRKTFLPAFFGAIRTRGESNSAGSGAVKRRSRRLLRRRRARAQEQCAKTGKVRTPCAKTHAIPVGCAKRRSIRGVLSPDRTSRLKRHCLRQQLLYSYPFHVDYYWHNLMKRACIGFIFAKHARTASFFAQGAHIAFAFATLARTASILAQGARIGAVLAHLARRLAPRTYPPDNSARRTPRQASKKAPAVAGRRPRKAYKPPVRKRKPRSRPPSGRNRSRTKPPLTPARGRRASPSAG